MNDAELLRRELRAAREELIRKRAGCSDEPGTTTSRLPLMPDRGEAFLRLSLMDVEALQAHVDRLERDLDDLQQGIDRPDE